MSRAQIAAKSSMLGELSPASALGTRMPNTGWLDPRRRAKLKDSTPGPTRNNGTPLPCGWIATTGSRVPRQTLFATSANRRLCTYRPQILNRFYKRIQHSSRGLTDHAVPVPEIVAVGTTICSFIAAFSPASSSQPAIQILGPFHGRIAFSLSIPFPDLVDGAPWAGQPKLFRRFSLEPHLLF